MHFWCAVFMSNSTENRNFSLYPECLSLNISYTHFVVAALDHSTHSHVSCQANVCVCFFLILSLCVHILSISFTFTPLYWRSNKWWMCKIHAANTHVYVYIGNYLWGMHILVTNFVFSFSQCIFDRFRHVCGLHATLLPLHCVYTWFGVTAD